MYDLLGPIFGAHWHKAAAIAWAESHGDTHARGVNSDGSVDRGLFQINSKAHPEVTDAVAYSAHGAAVAAYAISKGGTDWSPWSTNSIADPSSVHMPNADDAGLFGVGRGPGLDTVVNDKVNTIGKFLSKLSILFNGNFWIRVGLGAAGVACIIFGITLIGKQYLPTGMPMPIPV